MDKNEQKALDDIKNHGCHILQVLAEEDHPPWSYSIGIATNFQKPDLCVIGLKEPIAKFVINKYVSMLKQDENFLPGKLYSGFLEGFDVCFEEVAKKYYKDYFGWGHWYYNGDEFRMRQLVFPTTSGIYPWSENAPEDFQQWQPILTETGKTFFHSK